MKARDCNTCRKQIAKECEQEFLKKEYTIYKDAADTFATFATVSVLMAMVRRGRSEAYIQKLYDELVLIYSTPNVFGKEVRLTDMMHRLEKNYGIDFSRIHVNLETEKEFIKSMKGAKS